MLSSSLMFVYFECSVFDIIQDNSLCLMHHLRHVAATLEVKLSDTVVDEVGVKCLKLAFYQQISPYHVGMSGIFHVRTSADSNRSGAVII